MFDVYKMDFDGSITVWTVYAIRQSETTSITYFLIYDERWTEKWRWVNSYGYSPYKP